MKKQAKQHTLAVAKTPNHKAHNRQYHKQHRPMEGKAFMYKSVLVGFGLTAQS